MLSAIVAIDNNNGIGKDNDLLYSHKLDMKRFVEKTKGKTVIMGYKTWVSLKKPFLPGRKNVVLLDAEGPEDIPDIFCDALIEVDDIEKLAWSIPLHFIENIKEYRDSEEEFIIIGGANIYDRFYPFLDRLYLTIFDRAEEADKFFPKINWKRWDIYFSEQPEEGMLFLDMERK